MKKLVLSTVAAAMLATSASAVSIGVGTDVLGGAQVLRIAVDGLATGLRVEPRIMFASGSNSATTTADYSVSTFGIGAYYDITKAVSVGLSFDMQGVSTMNDVKDSTNLPAGYNVDAATNIGIMLKAEQELVKNFTMAFEVGYMSSTTTAWDAGVEAASTNSSLQPYSAVTMRLFF